MPLDVLNNIIIVVYFVQNWIVNVHNKIILFSLLLQSSLCFYGLIQVVLWNTVHWWGSLLPVCTPLPVLTRTEIVCKFIQAILSPFLVLNKKSGTNCFSPQIFICCELKLHVKFHNFRTTPSGREVTWSKERRRDVNSGHYVLDVTPKCKLQ